MRWRNCAAATRSRSPTASAPAATRPMRQSSRCRRSKRSTLPPAAPGCISTTRCSAPGATPTPSPAMSASTGTRSARCTASTPSALNRRGSTNATGAREAAMPRAARRLHHRLTWEPMADEGEIVRSALGGYPVLPAGHPHPVCTVGGCGKKMSPFLQVAMEERFGMPFAPGSLLSVFQCVEHDDPFEDLDTKSPRKRGDQLPAGCWDHSNYALFFTPPQAAAAVAGARTLGALFAPSDRAGAGTGGQIGRSPQLSAPQDRRLAVLGAAAENLELLLRRADGIRLLAAGKPAIPARRRQPEAAERPRRHIFSVSRPVHLYLCL